MQNFLHFYFQFFLHSYNIINNCYNNGFCWEENGVRLYNILDRVSCWCCANKNKKELDNMRIYLPNYYLLNIELLKTIKQKNKKGAVVDKAREQFMKMF